MTHFTDEPRLPVIDLAPYEIGNPWRNHVAAQVDWAATEFGIFRVTQHGIDQGLIDSLGSLSRRFVARESAAERRRLPDFRDVVHDYSTQIKGLAHRLMTSFARGLHLDDTYFVDRYTGDAASQLQIDCGSATDSEAGGQPGALLTLLHHDELAKLQVRHGAAGRALEVPHLPGALICAVGECLERLSGGRYPRARYRLVGAAGRAALAMPFHFGTGIGADAREQHARAA
jgi:isopenicillin N synthase-like dioxygenase